MELAPTLVKNFSQLALDKIECELCNEVIILVLSNRLQGIIFPTYFHKPKVKIYPRRIKALILENVRLQRIRYPSYRLI